MNKTTDIIKAINVALSNGLTFYIYKKNDTDYNFGVQIDKDFTTGEGFKIAPFIEDTENVKTEIFKQYSLEEILNLYSIQSSTAITRPVEELSTTKEQYSESFQKITKLIESKKVDKIVLSRIIVERYCSNDWGAFFMTLTEKYPNAFCFMFYTPVSGAWCGASPELLGNFHDSLFETMALAGTKPISDTSKWDNKNLAEQNYVVDFISSILKKHDIQFKLSEQFNKEAGFVKHLCNKFTAKISSLSLAQTIVSELHPTPALAGTPQNVVVQNLPDIETHSREYYGGYIGCFKDNSFDFYVNLRSMRFDNLQYKIFVGGGITNQSCLESEWKETENKSKTLLALFQN